MSESTLRLLAVAGGGALGASARYLVSGYIGRLSGESYPWGTTSVNLLGALLFGLIWSLFDRQSPPGVFKVFLLGGFLGSFTTFSTLAFETTQLFGQGKPLLGLLNLGLQNIAGLALIYVGFGAGDLVLRIAERWG